MIRILSILILTLYTSICFSQNIKTIDTINLDEVAVKILREPNKKNLSVFSINSISTKEIQRYASQINLSEYLNLIPSVFIMNNNNFAQDERISIRGFGSRANFGVRGIKIFVDDIPETFVDGQSQIDNINFEIIDNIEVLRGVNSSLYGSSSGGVISIRTIEDFNDKLVKANLSLGSFNTSKFYFTYGVNKNDNKLILHLNQTKSDGYRDNSEFKNLNFNLKYVKNLKKGQLKIIANYLNSPYANDPGGLKLDEVNENRRSARDRNLQYDSGEKVEQFKIGIHLKQKLKENLALQNHVFLNKRFFEGKLPYSNGGIIDLTKNYWGYNLNIIRYGLLNHNFGLEFNNQRDLRKRNINNNGISGDLVMNQNEDYKNFSIYYSNSFNLGKFTFNNSIRYDDNNIGFLDNLNKNQGDISLSTFSPASNINYEFNNSNELFINYSSGFETPTLNELSSTVGNSGFNSDLKTSKFNNHEIGFSNLKSNNKVKYRITYFYSISSNEISPYELENYPGQKFYRNAGKTVRKGLESEFKIGISKKLSFDYISSIGSYKFLDFTISSNSLNNNRMPGIPNSTHYFNLDFKLNNKLNLLLNYKLTGDMYADNFNNSKIENYSIFNLKFLSQISLSKTKFDAFVSFNNILNEKYFDNIRINAFGSRHYEPAPGFNIMFGVRK